VWWPKPDGSCACGNPSCTDQGKHPITSRGQHDATTDPVQIDAWFAQYPTANIGIALAPSGLMGFDIDKPEAYQAWAEIEQKFGEPNTTVQVSGSGCHHVIFKRPAFAIKGTYDKKITLRGNNYILAAPSLHKSGGRYSWQDGHAPWETPPVELAPALAEALRRPEQAPSVQNHDYPTASPELLQEAFAAMMKHGPEIKDVSPAGHTRAAWGILVNDFALSANEAVPLIRAYNAMCVPPWPEERLFGSPCRDGQSWNGQRGERRDAFGIRGAGLGVIDALGLRPPLKEMWLEDVSLIPMPPVQFYSTGFKELDRLLGGGFRTRQLTGFIGPPSAGKSALVGHWLLLLAKYRPVLHCSLELDKHEIFARYAAHEMRLPWSDAVRGVIPQADMARAVKGIRIKLAGEDEFDRLDPFASLEAMVIRMTAENGGVAPIIAIDYIQLMARGASTEMRHKVGELSWRARKLSQKFDTVVIGVFTTQRSNYNIAFVEKMRAAQDPTAYLGAAKESGDIEFDCATLLYLDVDKLHEGPRKPAQVAVARCRQGDVGFVGMRAQLDVGSFDEDQSAVAEFASESRKAKKEADSMDVCCRALLEAIRTMPNRPWREIRAKAKTLARAGGEAVDLARTKLIGDRVIEAVDRYNAEHRKEKGGTYVILKELSDSDGAEQDPLQSDD
jgi:hypothetical protein